MDQALGGAHPVARPTKFNTELGIQILMLLDDGLSRRRIAAAVGVSLRTLQTWLARGRGGLPSMQRWASSFDRDTVVRRRISFARYLHRLAIRDRKRWRLFRAARERWWLDRLGPVEFWKRRIAWHLNHGNTQGVEHALAELERSFCTKRAP
jgi:hypothetical protein